MIKFIHNNKRFIGVVFLFVAVCFMITGVGLDILHEGPSQNRYAATVNDEKFTFSDFERTQRRITERYREMFGPNFAALAQSLRLNIAQQAMDSMVDGALLKQKASDLGFSADEAAVTRYIQTELFSPERNPNGFDPAAFREMLRGMGMNYRQFSAQVKEDLSRTTLVNLVRHTAVTTSRDARQRFEQQETTYTVMAAEVSTSKLLGEVPTPADTELQKYYESNATDFELPARVAYDYVALEPADFEKDVQVQPQDIEMFYTENSSRFSTPEQAKVRVIKILYPKESDPAKMSEALDKANKAREEALQGTPFETLVVKYSDDIPSKATGGSRGWLSRGKNPEKFDAAVFSTPAGSITSVIELDNGFEVVKVEERKDAAVRPLDEVRDSIASEIKGAEAPAYAAAKAREIVEEAKKNNSSLADVAKSHGLTVKSTSGLLEAGKDVDGQLRGLTDFALAIPTAERLVPTTFDAKETSVALQVKEFKEPTTAPFEEVKTRIVDTLKTEAARKLAEERAKELLEAVKAPGANFKKESEARKATLSGPVAISRAKADEDKTTSLTPAARSAVFASKSPTVIDRIFPSTTGFTVTTVTEIKNPDAKDASKAVDKYREEAQQAAERVALESTVDLLKASAELDIDQSLLVAQ